MQHIGGHEKKTNMGFNVYVTVQICFKLKIKYILFHI
jgi:hypothetical protein